MNTLNLDQFYGTENYYQSTIFAKNILHTDGIAYLALEGGAHWIIDAIASHILTKKALRRERFHVWTLKKTKGTNRATLRATDGGKGTAPKTLARQFIPYTDFPLDEITIYCEWGSIDGKNGAWIIMLPSER